MKTVNEVSKIAGISIRALQYYDKIGLLKPSALERFVNDINKNFFNKFISSLFLS